MLLHSHQYAQSMIELQCLFMLILLSFAICFLSAANSRKRFELVVINMKLPEFLFEYLYENNSETWFYK